MVQEPDSKLLVKNLLQAREKHAAGTFKEHNGAVTPVFVFSFPRGGGVHPREGHHASGPQAGWEPGWACMGPDGRQKERSCALFLL